MAKEYQIRVQGKQRKEIEADLMAQLVVMLGRQLAEDARLAVEAARTAEADNAKTVATGDDQPPAGAST